MKLLKQSGGLNDSVQAEDKYVPLNKPYCPSCTGDLSYRGTEGYFAKDPVFLIKRNNRNTNDWFWGCPNFPRCKHSRNRPKTIAERNISTWAWANAQGGY